MKGVIHIVAHGLGDRDKAVSLLEGASEEARAQSDRLVPAWSRLHLGLIACNRGDVERAAELLRDRPISTSPAFHHYHWDMLWLAAVVAHAVDRFETAACFIGAAEAASFDIPATFPERVTFERAEEAAMSNLGPDTYAAAWERGHRMRTEELHGAMEQLLAGAATPLPPDVPDLWHDSPLSPREQEVLQLLADGMSNQEISDELYISHRTAAHHVANILAKLDLNSRTSAVAYAIRQGLA